MLPTVAIIGRTNVGKSTFFNKITGKRISIVKNVASVTRDRIYAKCEWRGKHFLMIDTGGIELKKKDDINSQILNQAYIAIDTADLILFFVDVKDGIVLYDYEIANLLKKSGKKVILVVNKLDVYDETKLIDFYRLNLGEPIGISASQGINIGDLLDLITEHIESNTVVEEETIKIAIVGKPNVGKSTLVNKMLGYERVIVSSTCGTTRDAIDTNFKYNNNNCILIDTAGLRRKREIEKDSIEEYAVIRAISSINRSDVVIVVLDASMKLSSQDIKILGLCHEAGKPNVVAINKSDLVEEKVEYHKQLKEELSFMKYLTFCNICAKFGENVNKLLKMVFVALDNSKRQISSNDLNEILGKAFLTTPPPSPKGKQIKFYYAFQSGIAPPKFTILCNNPQIVHFSYLRYIENSLRYAFDFSSTPIKIVLTKNS